DTLPKCTLKDQDCLKDLYGTIVRDIGSTGVPELGIPAVDPIELQNVTVSVLGVVDITLVKGVATGNEKFVMKNFGKAFIDKATEFYFEYAGKFFDVVPTKNYLTDDLSSFAKP
ncbi:DUF233 protein, partial [Operophtera brumata]